METPEFTYMGLLGVINESGTQFKALAFANCSLTEYLESEHINPQNNRYYRITESKNGKAIQITLSGNEIMKQIENQAQFYKITFHQLNYQIHYVFINAFIQRSVIMVYEIIKNYNDLNNKNMIRELSKNDWFRMLRLLRDHFAHFSNMGKQIVFPAGQPYNKLHEVTWNGFTIKKGQLAQDLIPTLGYTMDLLDHCFVFLRDNEATLK